MMGSRAGARVLRCWRGGVAFVALAAVALLLLTLGSGALTHEVMASAAPRPPPPNALPVIGGCIPPNTYRTSRTFNISGHLVRVEITLTITEAAGGFRVVANVTLAPVSGATEVFFTPPLADMAVKTDLGTYVWSHGKFFIQVMLKKKLPVSTRMSLRVNGTCVEGVALYIRPVHRYVVLGSSVVTGELVEALSKALPQGGTRTPPVVKPTHTSVTPKHASGAGETLVIYVIYSSNGSIHVVRGLGRLVSEVGGNASVRVCINGTCLTSTLTSRDGVVSLEGGLANMLKDLIGGGKVLAVAVFKPSALKALPQLLNLEVRSSGEAGSIPRHPTTVSVQVKPESTVTTATTPSAEAAATTTSATPAPKTMATTTASTVTRSVPTAPVVKSVPTTTQQHVTHTHTATATTASRSSTVGRPPVGRVEWLATAIAAAIAVGVGVIAYLAMRWRP